MKGFNARSIIVSSGYGIENVTDWKKRSCLFSSKENYAACFRLKRSKQQRCLYFNRILRRCCRCTTNCLVSTSSNHSISAAFIAPKTGRKRTTPETVAGYWKIDLNCRIIWRKKNSGAYEIFKRIRVRAIRQERTDDKNKRSKIIAGKNRR